MIDLGGATTPFLEKDSQYPLQVIYEDDGFLIASGKDKDYTQYMSIGIRWRRSRSEEPNKQNPTGFPSARGRGCWCIIPNDLAICLLTNIKDRTQSKNCKIEKDKIYEVLQILIKQEQERVNRTKDSQ